MKKIIFFIGLYFPLSMFCQNLVPNSGFDIVTDCNVMLGTGSATINEAPPWSSATQGTPDLFNSCFSNPELSIPGVSCKPQPISGDGYAGIVTYVGHHDTREYMSVPLTTPLVKNETYYMNFWVRPRIGCPPHAGSRFIDALGMALTEVASYPNVGVLEYLPIIPQIEYREMINDTINWTRICGSYIADGTEAYAIIGNFRSNAETNIEPVNTANPGGANHSYMFIENIEIVLFDPIPDTLLLCNGETEQLNARFLDANSYEWNTGVVDSIITISKPGEYTVEITIGDCVLRDTMIVIDMEEMDGLEPEISFCEGENITLLTTVPGIYEWSTGNTTSSVLIEESGDYELTVTNECGVFEYLSQVNVEKCDCNIFIPNAFSPNGDGINDKLEIFIGCDFDYKIKTFKVFSRWGENIYSLNQSEHINWNGYYKNKRLPLGVYVWFLEYDITRNGITKTKIKTGDITIVD